MFKLVIVDDEYYTLEGMREILDWSKYDITIAGTAADGTEGLRVIRETDADIVIADICMSEMNGLDMLEQLRKQDYHGRVIILSGYQSFEYAQRSIDLKVEKYLTKPINREKLEAVIEQIVREFREERGGGHSIEPPELFSKILSEIDLHYREELSLSHLAEQFYCSPVYISKAFKRYVGMNYLEYITKKRIDAAKELLAHSSMLIDEVMSEVGYQDAKHFRNLFKKQVGISPSEYRKKTQL